VAPTTAGIRRATPADTTPRAGSKAWAVLAPTVIPGFIVGLLVGGVGSRVAMRVMAMTSPLATGLETDFGATVGEITVGGTIFLLFGGAVVGVFGSIVYAAVQRWLPGRGLGQGLVFGVLLLALFSRALIDPGNEDLVILTPPALAIAMFGSLFILYGLVFVRLKERLEPVLSRPARPWLGIAMVVLAVPSVLLGLPALIIIGGLYAVGGLVVAGILLLLARSRRTSGAWRSHTVTVVGRVVVAVLSLLGAALAVTSVVQILSNS
jgi:hypothetical protein